MHSLWDILNGYTVYCELFHISGRTMAYYNNLSPSQNIWFVLWFPKLFQFVWNLLVCYVVPYKDPSPYKHMKNKWHVNFLPIYRINRIKKDRLSLGSILTLHHWSWSFLRWLLPFVCEIISDHFQEQKVTLPSNLGMWVLIEIIQRSGLNVAKEQQFLEFLRWDKDRYFGLISSLFPLLFLP